MDGDSRSRDDAPPLVHGRIVAEHRQRLIGYAEIASYLGITVGEAIAALATGAMPWTRVDGSRSVWVDDADAWLCHAAGANCRAVVAW